MREIVLDTETTGLDPLTGDRLVEVGCVELVNHLPTGRAFHKYVNPERDVPVEATNVHGLTTAFLSDKPVFAEVVAEFLEFVADSPLVIHNAEFDMKFINHELKRLGFPAIPMSRALDTLKIARQRYPGAPATLDALCRRFSIDNSSRTKHGALLDAELLAEVYLELSGGRQPAFALAAATAQAKGPLAIKREPRAPRPHAASPEELAAHAAFLGKVKNAIWLTKDDDQAVA